MNGYGTCKKDQGWSCWCCRADTSKGSYRKFRKRGRQQGRKEIQDQMRSVFKPNESERPAAEGS